MVIISHKSRESAPQLSGRCSSVKTFINGKLSTVALCLHILSHELNRSFFWFVSVTLFFTSFNSRLLPRSLPISVIATTPNSKLPAFGLFSRTFLPSRKTSKSRICEYPPQRTLSEKKSVSHVGRLPASKISLSVRIA